MCPVWNPREYRKISKELKEIGDIDIVSKKYGIDRETLMIIFQQKEVRRIIEMHRKMIEKRDKLFDQWLKGKSIVELAEEERFSPVLMMQIILAEMNISKKRTKKIKKNPEIVGDERLEREIREAMAIDFLYSPKAHEEQRKRGEEGERRLYAWLDSKGVKYIKESEMPKKGIKTPDALLNSPLEINGHQIFWIDSKASFGDPEEIKRSYERQFKHYIKIFGFGAVIYWYGYVDIEVPEGLIVLDSPP